MKVAIVGAGLIGRLLGFYLSQNKKFKLTIYDDKSGRSAALAAAGMISPFTELDSAKSWMLPLGLDS